jgi:hypothetical protein
MIYVLPMPTLYKLKLPSTQRIGLMILFGIGGVIVVAGSFRAYWVHYVVFDTYDVTWEGFQIWVWTAVETNVGVICGCIPSLRPLLFGGRGRNGTQTQRSYGSAGSRKQRSHQAPDDLEMETKLTSNDSTIPPSSSHGNYGARSLSEASKSSLDKSRFPAQWDHQKLNMI